jgi:photosystem II stability/assembly factor-like uncharacterized protein
MPPRRDSSVPTPDSPFAAKRFDSWKILGPGGGGAQFQPAISPHDEMDVLNSTDMSEGYISHDGGVSWRMFNLRGHVRWYVWDPVDRNTAYAKTTGLFRTTDCARTWSLVHPDPANIRKIAAIGDHGFEVIFTKDGSEDSIEALAVDPSDSKTLYAVMSSGDKCSLAVSSDWGETWAKSSGLPSGGHRIWIAPKSPKSDRTLLVAATNSISVRRAGKWIHNNPPAGVARLTAVSVGFAPDGSPVVYAVSGPGWRGDEESPAAVFVSMDSGATWTRVDGDVARQVPAGTGEPPLGFQTVECCPSRPNVAYVSYKGSRVVADRKERYLGVAKTLDFGATWKLVWLDGAKSGSNMHNDWLSERFGPEWGENPFHMSVAHGNPDFVLATDFGRSMMTRDGGASWSGVFSKKLPNGGWTSTGLDMTTCYGIHFDPFHPKRVFICYTDIGLMASDDGGVSWQSATTSGVPEPWVNTAYWLVFDPEVKGRCWAVMSGVHDLPFPKMWNRNGYSHFNGGVVASDDSGRTWRRSTVGMPETAATDIILDPKSPSSARVLYVAGLGTGVWKSTDSGKSWAKKNNGIRTHDPFCWRIVMDAKGALYLVIARRSYRGEIGNDDDGFLYRSTDGAETWQEVKLPAGVSGPHGIAVDPRDTNRLYLACWGLYNPEGDADGGILLSEDAGKSWKWAFQRHQHVYDVIADPANPDVLYAGTMTFAVWRSPDKGATWSRVKGYTFKQANRVIVDPFHPDRIFVTTFGGSVWYGPALGDPKAVEDVVTPAAAYGQ